MFSVSQAFGCIIFLPVSVALVVEFVGKTRNAIYFYRATLQLFYVRNIIGVMGDSKCGSFLICRFISFIFV